MPNRGHTVRDVATGKAYPAKAAAGRDLAHLVDGDPNDQFVFFAIARAYPRRFEVLNKDGEWVRLDDPSAPVGTLRPRVESRELVRSGMRTTSLVIDERKYEQVRTALGTATLRDTVDRSFDEVLIRAARMRDIERLRRMEGLDLNKPSIMRDAWRQVATYLAEKSAIVHLPNSSVAARLMPLLLEGEIATCGVVELGGMGRAEGQPVAKRQVRRSLRARRRAGRG